MQKGTIEIFKTDKGTDIQVVLENDTIWLNQEQIALVFGTKRPAITKHIKNIFESGELQENMVSSKMELTTQHGAIKGKTQSKNVKFYNLDTIISVGYRVNTIRATQFRQWATQRLKEYLVEGVAINEKRLLQQNKELQTLHDGIRIISRAIEDKASSSNNDWLLSYSLGLQLLDDYDHELLDKKGNHTNTSIYPSVSNYYELVERMRPEFNSDIFGRKKDDSFESAIKQIEQSFDGMDLYKSIEEKAAILIYLIIKNHAFIDGNKRIAAACFLLFLNQNELLYNKNGTLIISNEALASLTLFVAASKPEEMETVKNLLISVLNRNI